MFLLLNGKQYDITPAGTPIKVTDCDVKPGL